MKSPWQRLRFACTCAQHACLQENCKGSLAPRSTLGASCSFYPSMWIKRPCALTSCAVSCLAFTCPPGPQGAPELRCRTKLDGPQFTYSSAHAARKWVIHSSPECTRTLHGAGCSTPHLSARARCTELGGPHLSPKQMLAGQGHKAA